MMEITYMIEITDFDLQPGTNLDMQPSTDFNLQPAWSPYTSSTDLDVQPSTNLDVRPDLHIRLAQSSMCRPLSWLGD